MSVRLPLISELLVGTGLSQASNVALPYPSPPALNGVHAEWQQLSLESGCRSTSSADAPLEMHAHAAISKIISIRKYNILISMTLGKA